MTILSLIKRIPSYASDVKINLNSCFESIPKEVSQVQLYGCALAAGYALRNEEFLNDVRSEAKIYLEDSDAMACKLAVINVAAYSKLNAYEEAAGIKQDASIDSLSKSMSFAVPGMLKVDDVDFMMYSLVASILHRSKVSIVYCINALKNQGVSEECLNFIAKLAATLCSVYEALEIETLRSYDFITREANF